jgi:hypothetical protein
VQRAFRLVTARSETSFVEYTCIPFLTNPSMATRTTAVAASVASCEVPGAACFRTMEIELRVTKESYRRPVAPDPTMSTLQKQCQPILQQNQREWSLSRDEVPYVLARKGMLLHDWQDVSDKADALWERRTIALLRDVETETTGTTTQGIESRGVINAFCAVGFIVSFFVLTLLDSWIDSASIVGFAVGFIGYLFVLGCLVPIVFVLVNQTPGEGFDFYGPKCFETLTQFEDDWSSLADEQRRVFQSIGVHVVPIKEVTKTRARCHVWTVGLRFSYELPFANIEEDPTLPMLSSKNVTSIPADAIHDLERLLQLNQTGNVETEEFQLLKSSILSKMSLPFQCELSPKHNNTNGARPVVSAAVLTGVGADNHGAGDRKQVLMELV